MHRVELKETPPYPLHCSKYLVPNAPCGVESERKQEEGREEARVPNAPCGVERKFFLYIITPCSMFLMHRVELKEKFLLLSRL